MNKESPDIKIIEDSTVILETYKDVLKAAAREIDLVFPSVNAIFRHRRSGIFDLLKEQTKTSSVKIRILMPLPQFNRETAKEIDSQFDSTIDFRTLDKRAGSTTIFAVVDGEKAIVMELKDDTKDNFYDAIGFAIFTTSKHIVSSYASIFDTLWHQTDLNEQIREQNLELQRKNEQLIQLSSDLRESFEALAKSNQNLQTANAELEKHDRMQMEFINVAAHELRTPTQAIVGYCEMIEMIPERTDEYIQTLKRNAERLYRLSSDILDVAKIETGTFTLNKSRFDLTQAIGEVINDVRKKTSTVKKEIANKTVAPTIEFSGHYDSLFIEADKDRIVQVLTNLLDNALKFTPSGTISVILYASDLKNEIIINIKDSGNGIDPQIYPRLFQKFVTKSDRGTGLGLFVSQNIVKAHGGKMFAKNNNETPGATFSFSLPTIDNN